MDKKPNVILITIDALRADHLGFMGYEKATSPNIDNLAKESVVFINAFSVGPSTPYSFPSILTSTFPSDYHGPYEIKKPRKLISEVLKEQGFTTAAFHSSPFLSDYFGYSQGWDIFKDIKMLISHSSKKKKEITFLKKRLKKTFIRFFPYFFILLSYLKYKSNWLAGSKIKGSFLTKTVKDFILSQENQSPFFAWAHYMDIHSPYFARADLQNRPLSFSEYIASYSAPLLAYHPNRRLKKIAKRYINLTRELYDDGIRYVDGQLKDLVSFLKEKGIYDDCIIILAGDHGEEFFEHGSGSHLSKLYNELLHVPLLIKIPGRLPETIKNSVSLIDLPSSICDILKIKREASFKGKNLFDNSDSIIFHQTGLGEIDFSKHCKTGNTIQYRIACQSKNWKYILNHDTKNEELYNLLTDSKEQNNLIHSEPEIVSRMKNIIEELKEKNPSIK